MKEKVFGIGMFKTGTTSLGKALEILGYKVLNGPWWPKDKMIVDPWYETPEEWPKYYDTIKDKTTQYDAFQDYPWMFLYKELDLWHPNDKFVLTVRDYESVAESDVKMWRRNGVSEDEIPPKEKFMERYELHKENVLKHFKNKDNLLVFNLVDGDGWDKLCNFLNTDIPNVNFPHLNKA